MQIFLVAICIGLVIQFLSWLVLHNMLNSGREEKEVLDSIPFNIALLFYMISKVATWVNITVFAALAVKTFILT